MTARGRRQDGIVLLVVLMVAILVAVIASSTLWLMKAHLRQVGKQRKDFQSLHAAEAGVTFFQNRLNSLPLCHSWFTRQDSLNIMGLLGDTTMLLASPYGDTRGFRIRNAQLIPNSFPPQVRFESVGGKVLPDGTLDLANGRPVTCEMRLRTLADFIRFSESASMNYGDGAVLAGRVYSGVDINVNGRIDFQKRVNFAGNLVFTEPDTGQVIFREGYEQATNPFTLDHVHLSESEARASCGNGLPYSYESAAKGLIFGEGRGFYYSGASKVLMLPLDSIRIALGMVVFRLYDLDTTRADLRGASVLTSTMPISQFNGIVHVDGEVWVRGTLSGRSLTVASTDDIIAAGDVRCSGNEAGRDRRVTLGLLAQDKFFVWGQAPTRTTVEAAIIAEDDSVASWGAFEDINGISWGAMGWSDSVTSSHPGLDASGAPGDILVPGNWVLNMLGCIITKGGGTAGPWVGNFGRTRNYQFDPDNIFSPPPKFPIMRARLPGIPMWEVTGWKEK